MALTACFVRHGESQANIEGIFANRVDQRFALTAAGIDQARELAARLRGIGATHVYTSPLPRARQSAETIGAILGVPAALAGALREYDCGEFEGLPYTGEHAWRWDEHARIEESWREGDPDARHPGGESATDIAHRFLPFMDALAARHRSSDTIALIGHGGTYLTALPMLFANVTVDDARQYGLGHCEIVTATWDNGRWTCRQWGEHRLRN